MDVMLNIIYNDFLNEGLYEGYRKLDVRLICGSKCDICLSFDVYIYDVE